MTLTSPNFPHSYKNGPTCHVTHKIEGIVKQKQNLKYSEYCHQFNCLYLFSMFFHKRLIPAPSLIPLRDFTLFFFFFPFSGPPRCIARFFGFLGQHLWHTEVSRLGAIWSYTLPAYTTAMSALSPVCNQHHSSQQCLILDPLSEAQDQTCNLIVPSRIRFH